MTPVQDATRRLAERLGLPDWATQLASRIHAGQLAESMLWAVLIYGGILGVVYVFERRAGADPERYRTRHFLNDVAWTLFYRGGAYNILVLAAITNAFDGRLASIRPHLLTRIPWPLGLGVYWIAADLVTYWWHRLQHGNRFLWAFHSVHHSQERLTMFTASRRHPLEQLSMDILIYFLVFHFLLGIPTRSWLPLSALITGLVAIQHAQLDWRLGPLARVFVSPRFHNFHHSADPRHANANFGFLFSCWDYLFGTALPEEPRPVRFGIEGQPVGETLWGQLVTPFRLLRGGAPADDPAPPPPAAKADMTRLAALLRRTGATVECDVHGGSMGDAVPDGATVRIVCDGIAGVQVGSVVAVLIGGALSVHRVVHIGHSPRARGWLLTSGDMNLTCDVPVPESSVVGRVEAARHERGQWSPPDRSGVRQAAWRRLLSRSVEFALRLLLEIDPRLARGAKSLVVLAMTPWVWLRPYPDGRTRSASRLSAIADGAAPR